MNKLLLTIVLFSFSIYGFSKKSTKYIPKGTKSVGVLPSFKTNKTNFGVGGNTSTFNQFGINLPLRYYVSKNFGIQVTFGYQFSGEKSDFGTGTATTNTTGPQMGIGVVRPMFLYAFVKGGSFYFNPSVQANYLTGTRKRTTSNTTTKNDVSGIQVGAWMGAEFFSKPIGVPQLALQAAVGLVGFNSTDVGGNKENTSWAFSPVPPQASALNFLNATFGFQYYFF